MIPEDARETLATVRGAMNPEAYRDWIWRARYPDPPPKSGRGWPLKRKSIEREI